MSEELDNARYGLHFGVQKSLRYHARRRRHFDGLHRFTVAIALIFGSATFAALLGDKTLAIGVFAGIITITSALDLVLGSAIRARDHHDFERRWTALEQQITRSGDYDEEKYAELRSERLGIEADEEPPLRVLDVLCHNETARSLGRTEHLHKVGPIQRAFAQWFDWRPDSI